MGASSVHKTNGATYMIAWHDQVAIEGPITSIVFYICDDCREAYLSPMYYAFDPGDCDGGYPDPHECTGNICPSCAGPYLEPNEEDDPRRPIT